MTFLWILLGVVIGLVIAAAAFGAWLFRAFLFHRRD